MFNTSAAIVAVVLGNTARPACFRPEASATLNQRPGLFQYI
ncbi:hypothetical protein PDR5_56580 [Pseudomonas sp. DR 5-09]|nr:hypothetical protein PDR5_56580 [Pseudomonas sp. DR 5-09]